jgi:hypothetical protein
MTSLRPSVSLAGTQLRLSFFPAFPHRCCSSSTPSKDKDEEGRAGEDLRVAKSKRTDLELKCTALQSEVAFFERENARLAEEVH